MESVIHKFLRMLSSCQGSDLYLITGAPPCAKIKGSIKPLDSRHFKPGEVEKIANAIMDPEQRELFKQELEMTLAITMPQLGRFRLNMFRQRNEVSIVVRNIQIHLPKFFELGLPEVIKEIVMYKQGLVFFVGASGSGKSTSIAAALDYRNSSASGHIITIEDPIEFVFGHKKSLVNQREVGTDTRSFNSALKNAIRQDPDVIFISDIMDPEILEQVMHFSETGHLSILSMHANNTIQALERILHIFPEDRQQQLLYNLANNLQAIVCQRLVHTVDNKRCAAVEVLLNNNMLKKIISEGRFEDIRSSMKKFESDGMQTFDDSLYHMYEVGKITPEEALAHADSPNDLSLRMRGIRSR